MPILVVANKADISAHVEGVDMSMSTLTGKGVGEVMERVVGTIMRENVEVNTELQK